MLRQNRPIETCYFDGDDDEQTFHLGAFEDNKLVSVASFFFEKHEAINEENQYRLRGMATLPEFQNQGRSNALLKMAFPLIKQNMTSLLWCAARTSAVGFYEKIGFEPMGEIFEVPYTGPHQLMVKRID